MRPRVLVLAVLLAGCASGGDAGVPTAPAVSTSPPPTDFPATLSPRPVVLIGDLLQVVDGLRGEDTVDGLRGPLDFTGRHPVTPARAPVDLPDGARVDLALIGSSDALRTMSHPTGTAPPATTPPATAPKLVGVEFGAAEFPTDRGPWTLPAWRFTTSAGTVLAWPAVEPDVFWKPGEVRPAVSVEQASAADQEVAVSMPAAPSPCPGDAPARNEPVVQETGGTVTVGVRTVGHVGDCARTLAVTNQPYRVPLAAPLGGRLLLDEHGGVIAVTKR
ncbi:hypothetical protein [Actinosynnema sp. NPDC023587]|uniref:hypothetical protein n=1 Tax=Actinosynnema sp. NPDC023587 TaxID=3154695 RepID=UPI0033C13408